MYGSVAHGKQLVYYRTISSGLDEAERMASSWLRSARGPYYGFTDEETVEDRPL